jgi:2-keto-4-pentenoate hydratase/2-oxohepta-3-ene-1,7-dioic acid hydratase in catechol pathway
VVLQAPVMANFQPPAVPVFSNKQVTCIQSPYVSIELPHVSSQLDYEVELLVVIGKRSRHVSVQQAHTVIAGCCISNDVSVRDWQPASPTTAMGKSFDAHGPCGPWIATADEVNVAAGLSLKAWVIGGLRQNGSTLDMVHRIAAQIEYLSTVLTLEPGCLLATGTLAGVGVRMHPQIFLKAGDQVRLEIEGLGHIENTVVFEPS